MVEVKRKERENIGSLLRRFSRRVQESGILIQARKIRFKEPGESKRKRKESALRREKIKTANKKLRELGKLDEETETRGNYRRGRR